MPGDEELPPYEVLAALAASLRRELTEAAGALAQARAELAEGRERIAELEARLRQNPRNSSTPPSSEGLGKPAPRPRSLRKRSGRKPGGQDGHKGTTLAQSARPDREIRHEPGCCGRCGAGLAGRPVTGVERRQVFDLQPVRAEVTEHQLIERECGCGHRTRGAAPRGAEAPVQYGPRIAAVIVYLYAGQFLSKDRTALALASCSASAVIRDGRGADCPRGRAAGRVPGARPRADRRQRRRRVRRDRVPGGGEAAWVHCARTGKYTLLMVHPGAAGRRSRRWASFPRSAGSPSTMPGRRMTAYTAPEHQLCCAHALRELQAVTDAAPGGQWCWATQAAEALTRMQQLPSEVTSQGRDAMDPAALAAQVRLYRSAVVIGASQTAARCGPLMKKHNALARRLLDRQGDYLRFTTDLRAPPDNDLASHRTSWVRFCSAGVFAVVRSCCWSCVEYCVWH